MSDGEPVSNRIEGVIAIERWNKKWRLRIWLPDWVCADLDDDDEIDVQVVGFVNKPGISFYGNTERSQPSHVGGVLKIKKKKY